MNRPGPGVYHGEGLVLPGGVTPTVSVTTPAAGVYSNSAACPTTVNYSPLAVGNQVNGKFKPLYYPCLGEAVIANFAMGSYTVSLITILLLVVIQTVILLVTYEESSTLSSYTLPCLVGWLINIYPCQLSMV